MDENILNSYSYLINFTLEQARMAHKGIRGARRGWVVNATPRPIYSQERPGTHCIGG
jgi:hypothetical protein